MTTRVWRRGSSETTPRQRSNRSARATPAVEPLEETLGELLGAARRAHGVANGDLLEREQQIGAGFDANGITGDPVVVASREPSRECSAPEHGLPTLVRVRLVPAFEGDVVGIPEPVGIERQEPLARGADPAVVLRSPGHADGATPLATCSKPSVRIHEVPTRPGFRRATSG